MLKVAAVAWRDFTHTVLTKAFLFAVVGVPAMIVAAFVAIFFIMKNHEEPPLIGTVAIVDSSGDLTTAAQIEFDEARMNREQMEAAQELIQDASKNAGDPMGGMKSMDAASELQRGAVKIDIERINSESGVVPDDVRHRVMTGELLAVVDVPAELLAPPTMDENGKPREEPRFTLISAESLDIDHIDIIEGRMSRAIVRSRVARTGADVDATRALLARPEADTKTLDARGNEVSESEGARDIKRLIPMFFMMLLWIASFTGGQHLLMSTIEEKSNKVMEVLLSAISPMQLMVGKIIGQGMVGLVLVGVYSSVSIVGVIYLASARWIDPMQIVYLFVYFIMAYFMIATMFAAVGSAVSDIREANNLVTPVMIIVMIPWMLWFPISQAPNGTVAQVCSYVPPAIPFVMILRTTADEPIAAWEILLSIVWGYTCVVAMMWMAAKIFRIGVLMQGKPPSLLQLLKWLRYDA
jgi:ABC-2 type transport system permease protein